MDTFNTESYCNPLLSPRLIPSSLSGFKNQKMWEAGPVSTSLCQIGKMAGNPCTLQKWNEVMKMTYTPYPPPSLINPLVEMPHCDRLLVLFILVAGNKLQTKQNHFLNTGISFWFPDQPSPMNTAVVTRCLPVS